MIPVMALTSCYSTIPVSVTPSRGSELILDMTPQATERMGGFLGRGTVSARGRLVDWEADTVVVAMLATQIARGDEQLWNGERVAIPREAVARITERRVNRGGSDRDRDRCRDYQWRHRRNVWRGHQARAPVRRSIRTCNLVIRSNVQV